jgi:hypothetical protein
MNRHFRFVSDPGHGYLRVKLEDIAKYGVSKKISGYSFVSSKFAYLEEDCDAPVFLKAVKEFGDTPVIKESYTNNPASCRRYDRFPVSPEYGTYRKELFGF